METEAARAGRFGHDLSLLILDMDDFKKINDTHGHLQGDEVLRSVGRILGARVARLRRSRPLRRRGVRHRTARDRDEGSAGCRRAGPLGDRGRRHPPDRERRRAPRHGQRRRRDASRARRERPRSDRRGRHGDVRGEADRQGPRLRGAGGPHQARGRTPGRVGSREGTGGGHGETRSGPRLWRCRT